MNDREVQIAGEISMSVDKPSHQAARAARALVRRALKAALATLDHRDQGQPHASLVLLATEPNGTPITLISGLALHTRNLLNDARASLLIDATMGLDDPMTGGRLTLSGRAVPAAGGPSLTRFLARHPAAQAYARLPDFKVFALHVSSAHYIAGFGRIVGLAPAVLATDITGAEDLIATESGLVTELNAEHAEAIARFAATTTEGAPGQWRVCGIDPDGLDLVHRSNTLRAEFPARVTSGREARQAVAALLRT
jgi:putative heme iron utilization protein